MLSRAKEIWINKVTVMHLLSVCFVFFCGVRLMMMNVSYRLGIFKWCAAIFFILWSIYQLFFARYVSCLKSYKSAVRSFGVPEWTFSVEFTDEDIIVTEHTAITRRLKYENIIGIKETEDAAIIRFREGLGIKIYKNAFVDGSWRECREKIKEKTEI